VLQFESLSVVNNQESHMRILRVGMIAIASLVAVGTLAGTLSAQGNNGNPSILQAVQAVQGTVNSLVTTLNSLVTTVNGINTATTPGNVLFTPAVIALPPDAFSCSAVNVSAVTHSVSVQLIDGNTGALLSSSTLPKPAGQTNGAFFTAGSGGTRAFCKITVNDGTKNDVRGSLALFGSATASDKDPIAAQ
jgi:hypothetical protein